MNDDPMDTSTKRAVSDIGSGCGILVLLSFVVPILVLILGV